MCKTLIGRVQPSEASRCSVSDLVFPAVLEKELRYWQGPGETSRATPLCCCCQLGLLFQPAQAETEYVRRHRSVQRSTLDSHKAIRSAASPSSHHFHPG